jgi:endoglucanase
MRHAVVVLLTPLWLAPALQAAEAPKVRLNTVGYLPTAQKRATVAGTGATFAVIRAKDGSTALEGKLGVPSPNADTGESLATADFTALEEPGEYRLDVPQVGKSAPFHVGADVYRQPFAVVTRGMYLWRCGTEVEWKYEGQTFRHDACHTDDAWLDLVDGRHVQANGKGGWHDAGDYNKYVVNAGVTMGAMLRAWEDFGSKLRTVHTVMPGPEGALPEYLMELKWELDWLLRMQAPDGAVYHKLSTRNFGGFILPEKETAERLFSPWGSAATADFVAMTAQAARAFRPFDPAYADRCLAASKKSYAVLQARPEDHKPDLRAFRTGAYQTSDPDDRLWAAAELWETTGEAAVLKDLETRIDRVEGRVDRDFDWGNVKNLGLFTYGASRREGRDPALLAKVRASFVSTADAIVATRDAHGYARPLGMVYYWGCNGSVARQSLVLMAADRVAPRPEYRATILDALNHLFGRNVHGRSYVTGLGDQPPLHPHDRRSGGDAVDAPWPGYLVGGPHPRAANWNDRQDDYRTNEIAINWNGALIYALAAALDDGS